MKQFEIQSFEAGQRLDRYVEKLLRGASRNFIYKMMRKKNIVLNDKKAAGQEPLKTGDIVKIYFSDETFEKFAGQSETKNVQDTVKNGKSRVSDTDVPQIIYEDENILILNKPSGMLSQKSVPSDYSANDFVIDYLLKTGALTEENLKTFHPSVCNRLDRNTSGLLIAGKSMRGLQEMSKQLKTRDIKKYYLCLVKGKLEKDGHLTGYLKKNRQDNKVTIEKKPFPGADPIETSWHPVEIMDDATLLCVHLITGRTHQIRAHLAHIGHPVLGDYKYGDKKYNQMLKTYTGIHSQLLHAWKLILPDGRSWKAEPPDSFDRAADFLNERKQDHK